MNQSALEEQLLDLVRQARQAGIDQDTIAASFEAVIAIMEREDDE